MTGDLVAEDERVGIRAEHAVEEVKLRAADPGGLNTHDMHLTGRIEECCPHRTPSQHGDAAGLTPARAAAARRSHRA